MTQPHTKRLRSWLARELQTAIPAPQRRELLEALIERGRLDLMARTAWLRWREQASSHTPVARQAVHQLDAAALVDRVVTRWTAPRRPSGTVATSSAASSTMQYVAPMLGFQRSAHQPSLEEAAQAEAFFQWGARPSFGKARTAALARNLGRPLLHCEDGVLLRSIPIGLTGTPCLSLYVDDTTSYYDAYRASRLERILASDRTYSSTELGRSRECIQELCRARLSKYNHAPDTHRRYGPRDTPKVLLVDQRRDDASVVFGQAGPESFQDMLAFALRRWPKHHVLLKRHPDQISAGRDGYFNRQLLTRFADRSARLSLVDEEVNPHTLFDQVDAVCVVTSGMGFEAILAGLPVFCFGVPFFSGWGLTFDLGEPPPERRGQKRTIEEVFHALSFESQVYFDPERGKPVSFEQQLELFVHASHS